MPNPISNVPQDEVGDVVQEFVDEGSSKVLVEKEPQGTYKVTPTPQTFAPEGHTPELE